MQVQAGQLPAALQSLDELWTSVLKLHGETKYIAIHDPNCLLLACRSGDAGVVLRQCEINTVLLLLTLRVSPMSDDV
jgi:hypothetical protein